MTKVIADITMSLDGFVTGPDAGPKSGLGRGGEPLHEWVFGGDKVDEDILREAVERTGAVVMGRRLFDIVDAPDGWNDDIGYGAGHATAPPFFVVTHSPPENVRLGLHFCFVPEGVAAAVDQARAAAGEKDVIVMGGGNVIRQALDARVIDELRIHLSPIVLGAGTPLFADVSRHEFVQKEVRVSPKATHLLYEVKR